MKKSNVWTGSKKLASLVKNFSYLALITYKRVKRTRKFEEHFVSLNLLLFSSLHVDSPIITSSKSNVTTEEGNTAELNCLATGHPIPKINWTRNGVFVDTGSPLRLNVTIKNNGECYTCIVYNGIPPDKSVTLCLDVRCEYSNTMYLKCTWEGRSVQ